MLIGRIAVDGVTLRGHLSSSEVPLQAKMHTAEVVLKATIASGGIVPTYEGDYRIAPDFLGQVLPTRDKLLREDVTVEPIYTSQVENLAGGYTFYIGGEFHA